MIFVREPGKGDSVLGEVRGGRVRVQMFSDCWRRQDCDHESAMVRVAHGVSELGRVGGRDRGSSGPRRWV
eukprot:5041837-Alexandrium_andersonii.AAC.1